jgi:hypothetical protein
MNGRMAKFIRKEVYGDLSIRTERKYKWGDGKQDNKWGTIQAVGKRAEYQAAKKIYYKRRKAM